MKLNTALFWQIVVWLGAVSELLAPQVPPKWKPWLTTAAAVISLTLHQHSGVRNPDGTPAQAAWEPPTKKP